MSAVTKLYGSSAGDQIQSSRMHAYTFENLRVLLEQGTGVEAVQIDLGSVIGSFLFLLNLGRPVGKKNLSKNVYRTSGSDTQQEDHWILDERAVLFRCYGYL